MGKRARRRTDAVVEAPERPVEAAGRSGPASMAAAEPPHAVTPDRRARLDEAPKPPWHPVPLTELCILAGLVLIVAGFVAGPDGRRGLLLAIGFTLVSIAAVELSAREHLAGYRSHSALLAAVVAVLVNVPLFVFTGLPSEGLTILGVAVFGVGFAALRRLFQHRAGGLGFRV